MEDQNNTIKGKINEVPLAEAEEATFKWQEQTDASGKHYPKSFLFNKVDFTQILNNEEEVTHIKLYPAIKDDGKVTLLVVGVKQTGRGNNDYIDIINPEPDAEVSGIYDFAYPCPNTCGISPLYKFE